jgi:hypothetical protein
MLIRAFQNQSANLKRGLGLLLVIFIFYGTTVEAAHGHGRVLLTTNNATSLADANQTSTLGGSKIGCNDCLICQLHQSFNTTLVGFRVAEPPTQLRVQVIATLPHDVLSQVTGPTSGRAPPFIS